MKIVFLDIDGVLNNCQAIGVFHETSIITFCVEILNFITQETGAKIVIISSWKDDFDFENSVKPFLYRRGVDAGSIIGCTEKDMMKELGIMKYLAANEVENFVIIDDSLELEDNDLKAYYVKTNTYTGLIADDIEKVVEILGTQE